MDDSREDSIGRAAYLHDKNDLSNRRSDKHIETRIMEWKPPNESKYKFQFKDQYRLACHQNAVGKIMNIHNRYKSALSGVSELSPNIPSVKRDYTPERPIQQERSNTQIEE